MQRINSTQYKHTKLRQQKHSLNLLQKPGE